MKKLTADTALALLGRMKKNATYGEPTIHEGYTIQALEIALPILEQQERGDRWIEWSGGECPVHPGKRVDLKLRGGSITTGYPAGSAQWNHRSEDDDTDIIAYQITPGSDSGEEWIEWRGGKCPVSPKTIVVVRYRKGKEESPGEAGGYFWNNTGSSVDIIAYRIIAEQPTNQNGEQ